MTTIQVRAKEGRVAYSAPRNGKLIPTDAWIIVKDSPFVRRLADFHGDIEIKEVPVKTVAQAKKEAAPTPVAPKAEAK